MLPDLSEALLSLQQVREAVLAPRRGLLKGRDRLYAARAFFEALQLQKDKKVRCTIWSVLGDGADAGCFGQVETCTQAFHISVLCACDSCARLVAPRTWN